MPQAMNARNSASLGPGFPVNRTQIDVAVMVVARVFAVTPGDVMRTTRGRAGVALARQMAMYLAHVVGGLTLTDIGHHFRRDRTTVAHACRLIETKRDDPGFDRVVALLEGVVPAFANRPAASPILIP
jgi:chromosomal replication initiation ATPase DnaA